MTVYDDLPVFSPDGTKIAYIYQGAIRQMTSAGVHISEISGPRCCGNGNISRVMWHPDGTKFVFAAQPAVNTPNRIYSMNADGTGLTDLSQNAFGANDPDWSPDGLKIVFNGGDIEGKGTHGLYVMNANGSNKSPIVFGDAYAPLWSPDGTRILFCQVDPKGIPRTMSVKPDGSNLTPLVTGYCPTSLQAVADDGDADGVSYLKDNCPFTANLDQANHDNDPSGDLCDPDDDNDGYTDAEETNVGENPLLYCSIMRADVSGDGTVTIGDLAQVASAFLQAVTMANQRLNQDTDSSINLADLALVAGEFLTPISTCS